MKFGELATYVHTIEGTSSRLAITETLATLFRRASEEEIGKICFLLQGRVVPLYEAIEFGIADKFMIRAISGAYNVSEVAVGRSFKKSGDLGITAESCHVRRTYDDLSVAVVYEKLYALAIASGSGSQDVKITLLSELLSHVDSLSARYIARIPLGKLRLGFSEMTILDALSWMLSGDKSERDILESAYNLRPDIGYIAQRVKSHGVSGLSSVRAHVGAPILACLCQRLPSADEMIEKMGEVAVEPKFDGVRVQIHYQQTGNLPRRQAGRPETSVATFSRNLENTTDMFPELTQIGTHLNAHEVILDSEAVGIDPKTGAIISFQETTTRKRKHQVAETAANIPLRFFVFDILYKDGKDLLGVPLRERRAILEKTVNTGNTLLLSPLIVTDSAKTLRSYHEEQRKKGLEGVVVKKWDSAYEPGRRGYNWVKFKEEEGKSGKLTDTVDTVVMGYYRGEGKRTEFGIGALLVGIKRGNEFVTVTKIGTGVSDELWVALKKELSRYATGKQPKEYSEVHKSLAADVWVVPHLVVEVAADDITKSPTHAAGLALRFPRLVRIRTDKGPESVTSTNELTAMYKSQQNSRGQRILKHTK